MGHVDGCAGCWDLIGISGVWVVLEEVWCKPFCVSYGDGFGLCGRELSKGNICPIVVH